ncbi:MAG: transglycosylase domain-containing protein [Catonella sp.]|uniref:transglycosylase domain-containing protein n=1 Tax=Catonella sp. TaxID=2382125 RepID=UPI003FA09F35
MSYSRFSIEEKQRKYGSIPKKLGSKIVIWVIRILMVAVVAGTVLGGYLIYGSVKGIVDKAPKIKSVNVMPTGFQTYIYNAKGKRVRTVVGAGANRIYKKLDDIPKIVRNAFISIEDERFYEHGGIDVRGMFRAGFVTLLSRGIKKQGASTLTQQLLKNQVFGGGEEETIMSMVERKIQEQYLAIQLENIYSKDQLLEYYLNTINLGQNTLGVQTAALRYFNKNVNKLTLSEASVIAAITKNPTGNNPITHPENNAKRRKEVLANMLRLGYITELERNEAEKDDVYERIKAVNKEIKVDTSVNSYYVDATINQVVEDLCREKGYSVTQAYNFLYSGGLKIYTYQDPVIQKICNSVTADENMFAGMPAKWKLTYALSVQDKEGKTINYSEGHIQRMFELENVMFAKKGGADQYIEKFKKAKLKDGAEIIGERVEYTIEPQLSVTVIDQKTGAVQAIVGGRGKKTGNLTLNRATDTTRQPGSLFKVLSTYLPAIDTAGYTLASVQDDGEYFYPNSNKEVRNWWGKSYEGWSSYRRGIYRSMNIVTVKALEAMGLQPAFAYLKALGITTLTEDDNNYAVALGGLSKGTTNLEITGAYAAIANKGIYIKPSFYSKVLDHAGNVVLEHKGVSRQVMKDSTAFLLTDAMHDTLTRPDATAGRARLADSNMGQAAKTGSSTNDNDIWISGFTPYYTCSVWIGYDENGSQTGNAWRHLPIWKAIMDGINAKKKLKSKPFEVPESVTTALICSKCGKLAVSGLCDAAEGGSKVRKEYFAVGTVPTESCDVHVKLSICEATGEAAGPYCPNVVSKVFLVKNEAITQNDAYGKVVKRQYPTADTPYILTSKVQTKCSTHLTKAKPTPSAIETGEDDETEDVSDVGADD